MHPSFFGCSGVFKNALVSNTGAKITLVTNQESRNESTCKEKPDVYFVDEIKLEEDTVGAGLYNDLTQLVYYGYKDGKEVFSVTKGQNVYVTYWEQKWAYPLKKM